MTQQQLSYEFKGKIPFDPSKSTATKAEQVLAGKSGRIRSLILRFVRNARGGMTDEEIADTIQKLGVWVKHSTVVSGRNSLVRDGLVLDSGLRRLSPTSGVRVAVWEVVK